MEQKAVKPNQTPTIPYRLTQKEVNLVELCHALGYGQFIVYIENKQPVRVEELKKSIKL